MAYTGFRKRVTLVSSCWWLTHRLDDFGHHGSTIDIDALDISATELRHAIADGADVDEFISPLVVGYIEEKGLYARA